MQHPLKNWERIKRGYKFGEKTFYSPHHLGTDYIVPVGTPVYTPVKCEVFIIGDFPEGGKTVHIRFKNRKFGLLVMRFMHLSKMSPLGKYKAGEILGFTGNTGKLTKGPHLHIDISRKQVDFKNFKNFIDPEKFFG
jgi:murein DD-endopeptidase MepM/ murein hydrolase activator NlpD